VSKGATQKENLMEVLFSIYHRMGQCVRSWEET